MKKIKIGISSCLLGNKVRYDGGHKLDGYIVDTLGRFFEWVPVCPEVECGLPVPREPMRLVGGPFYYRLITIETGVDHTGLVYEWALRKLNSLERDELCGFIFKSGSPSSGISGVNIYSRSGMPVGKGAGIFGGALTRHFPLLPVIGDDRLHDLKVSENFIKRLLVYKRWNDFVKKRGECA